jgi:hypothetical protein
MYRSVVISTVTHIVILIIVARNVSPTPFAKLVGTKTTGSSVRCENRLHEYMRAMGYSGMLRHHRSSQRRIVNNRYCRIEAGVGLNRWDKRNDFVIEKPFEFGLIKRVLWI